MAATATHVTHVTQATRAAPERERVIRLLRQVRELTLTGREVTRTSFPTGISGLAVLTLAEQRGEPVGHGGAGGFDLGTTLVGQADHVRPAVAGSEDDVDRLAGQLDRLTHDLAATGGTPERNA
jgi:hypothetical protein